MKTYPIPPETTVVTSSYVTAQGLPILVIYHDFDEEDGENWQFHCGNGDFAMETLQLVRFSTVLSIDPTIQEVLDLPLVAARHERASVDHGSTRDRLERPVPWNRRFRSINSPSPVVMSTKQVIEYSEDWSLNYSEPRNPLERGGDSTNARILHNELAKLRSTGGGT